MSQSLISVIVPVYNVKEYLNTCVESIKKNSRNFAKRQYTWFRNQMQVHWYDVEAENYKEQILNDVKAWMES